MLEFGGFVVKVTEVEESMADIFVSDTKLEL